MLCDSVESLRILLSEVEVQNEKDSGDKVIYNVITSSLLHITLFFCLYGLDKINERSNERSCGKSPVASF